MTSEDDLVQHAEREVIMAALAWGKEQQRRVQDPTTPASERLKTAIYMLTRARTITGKVRLEEIQRAMREEKERKDED